MRILLIYCLALAFVLSGCALKLRPDSSLLSAIEGNYPTAEFEACGKTWHGLGVCTMQKGRDLSELNLKIQGYYKGNVRIDSGDCGVSVAKTYDNNTKLSGILSGVIRNSCVVTFTVSPVYPNQENTSVVTNGFRGHLRIKATEPGDVVETKTFRIPKTFRSFWKVRVDEKNPVEVFMEGCGVSYAKKFTPGADETIEIPLRDVLAGSPRTCVLEGLVRSTVYKDLLLTAIVAIHYDEFNPLPFPETKYINGSLTLTGDSSVTVLSVGSNFKIGNVAHFKVKERSIVRAITAKGRSTLGFFEPSTGGVLWISH